MWPPEDIAVVPTGKLLQDAKFDVNMMEVDLKDVLLLLEQTRLRAQQLKQGLDELRAWIAPIRRAPFDVLAVILGLCGENDWKTTLAFSAVSRQWREVVLATPNARRLLDPRNRIQDSTLRTFFERSGQCPPHIYWPTSLSNAPLATMADLLQCLSIWELPKDSGEVFPNLNRLVIRVNQPHLQPSDIPRTRFPALRHLHCRWGFKKSYGNPMIMALPPLPPLETLFLSTSTDFTWIRVMRECRNTLVALKVYLKDVKSRMDLSLKLPKLKCLEICSVQQEIWPVRLLAPSLEVYTIMMIGTIYGQITEDSLSNVRFLHLYSPPPLLSLPSLQFLRLRSYEDMESILYQLSQNSGLCPHLESIEVTTSNRIPDTWLNKVAEINQQSSRNIRLSNTSLFDNPFPGSFSDYMCEHPSCLNDDDDSRRRIASARFAAWDALSI